jgi:hypothetical protein
LPTGKRSGDDRLPNSTRSIPILAGHEDRVIASLRRLLRDRNPAE